MAGVHRAGPPSLQWIQNASTSTQPPGTLVRLSTSADGVTLPSLGGVECLGVLTQELEVGDFGFVLTSGAHQVILDNAGVRGDFVQLSGQTPGYGHAITPAAPSTTYMMVGTVLEAGGPGLVWVMLNPSLVTGSSGSLSPATTVVGGTSFGQSPVVGTDTNYAREGHSHGTPSDPIPGHVAQSDPHTQYALKDENNSTTVYTYTMQGDIYQVVKTVGIDTETSTFAYLPSGDVDTITTVWSSPPKTKISTFHYTLQGDIDYIDVVWS